MMKKNHRTKVCNFLDQKFDQKYSFEYAYMREWLGPGGLPGLQNRWRVVMQAAVGSTPIHSRLIPKD